MKLSLALIFLTSMSFGDCDNLFRQSFKNEGIIKIQTYEFICNNGGHKVILERNLEDGGSISYLDIHVKGRHPEHGQYWAREAVFPRGSKISFSLNGSLAGYGCEKFDDYPSPHFECVEMNLSNSGDWWAGYLKTPSSGKILLTCSHPVLQRTLRH